MYATRNENSRNAITRCYERVQVISRTLARPSGITTDVVYIERRKARVRPIRTCVVFVHSYCIGPRYDRRDPTRSDRVYLASFNYYSATLISRLRSLATAEYGIAPFVASLAIS